LGEQLLEFVDMSDAGGSLAMSGKVMASVPFRSGASLQATFSGEI